MKEPKSTPKKQNVKFVFGRDTKPEDAAKAIIALRDDWRKRHGLPPLDENDNEIVKEEKGKAKMDGKPD